MVPAGVEPLFNIFYSSDLRYQVSPSHTCGHTLGGVGGSLGLEAVGVLHVTFLLVGTLVSVVYSFRCDNGKDKPVEITIVTRSKSII